MQNTVQDIHSLFNLPATHFTFTVMPWHPVKIFTEAVCSFFGFAYSKPTECLQHDRQVLDKTEDLSKKISIALDKAIKDVIAETNAKNSYMVISDKKGTIIRIPAKDL